MSQDSISQYFQAITGEYTDWHPPLMSIVLKIVLASGGTIGILTLAQCAAGAFGIRALARGVLGLLYGDRIPPRRAAWISLLILLILLIPVTPLAFYLVTFWKDVWAMIFLLWIAALSLDLYREGLEKKRILLVAVLGAALGLVRHNAVVTLPVVGLALWLVVRRHGWLGRPGALGVAALPLLLYLAATPAMDFVFGIEELHPDSQIMVLDLVGLCAADRAVCGRLPWTRSHIRDESALARFRPGDFGFVFWAEPKPVDLAIRGDYGRLRDEYLRAIREFPLLMAEMKLKAFRPLLGVEKTPYFFHDSIVENPFGLSLNPRFAPVRKELSRVTAGVGRHPVLRWLSAVHLVWIVAGCLWVAGLVALSFREGRARYRFLAYVLLVPLGYYASYLLAAPVDDFRFMYPSTLAVQCVTLSWLIGTLAQKLTGRAPSLPMLSA